MIIDDVWVIIDDLSDIIDDNSDIIEYVWTIIEDIFILISSFGIINGQMAVYFSHNVAISKWQRYNSWGPYPKTQ